MTPLRKRMLEELQRRNYSESTKRSYLHIVADFAKYFHRSPDLLGLDEIREYQAHLIDKRKLNARTVGVYTAALRFLFIKTLHRPYPLEEFPYAKAPRRLPIILSEDEISRLIESAGNLYHRALLMTMYFTAARRAEVCNLKVEDVDSERMVVHIRRGKGGKYRDVPLDPNLRDTLREYYRWMRPKTYLFPGTEKGWRTDRPITTKYLWQICQEAAHKAGIKKHVSPHLIRHSFATHLLEHGADLPTLQLILGHADLRATSIYLHLSQRHVKSAKRPLADIDISDLGKVKRSRKLHKK